MGTPEQGERKSDGGIWSTIATGTRDVVIILGSVAAIAVLGVFIVQHYDDSKDATSVLGMLIPAISTIAAAAFGVAAGVKAGAAAGTSAARAERAQKEAVQDRTQEALSRLERLRPTLEPVMEAAGTRKRDVPPDQVAHARSEIASVEQSLRAAL
jgi:uncharacterized membrane protein